MWYSGGFEALIPCDDTPLKGVLTGVPSVSGLSMAQREHLMLRSPPYPTSNAWRITGAGAQGIDAAEECTGGCPRHKRAQHGATL